MKKALRKTKIIAKAENVFIVQLFTLLFFVYFVSYSFSHELWLETETFQIEKNRILEVNIKVGEKLQGSNRQYIPNNIEEFYWSQNGKKFNVNSRLGDSPAFSEHIKNNGLISIVYISKPSYLTYDTIKKFEKFANHKGLGPVKKLHERHGFPKKILKKLIGGLQKQS